MNPNEGATMKRKSTRDIPNFSHAPKPGPRSASPAAGTPEKRHAPSAPKPVVRPSTKPPKLGRRGG